MPDEPTPLEDLEPDEGGDGWDLIEQALHDLYPDRLPLHFGPILEFTNGGPDPLEAIAAYKAESPRPHWHLVGYGLTELFEKSSLDPDISGFGIELTLRIARGPQERRPPSWGLRLLQDLARLIHDAKEPFEPFEWLDLDAPVIPRTDIRALAFVEDPGLPPRDGPFGALMFVQVVTLTPGEAEALADWSPEPFLDVLAERHPSLIVDPLRPCALSDPEVQRLVDEGRDRDGSSQEVAVVDSLSLLDPHTLTLDPQDARQLARLLRGRTAHRRGFVLLGPELALAIASGSTPSWDTTGDRPTLTLPPDAATSGLEALSRGAWSPLPELTIRIAASGVHELAPDD